MYREILLGISGIELYPIVSLLLFVVTFGLVLAQVGRMDRGRLHRLAALPLDGAADETDVDGK
jgi:hypothetical protein